MILPATGNEASTAASSGANARLAVPAASTERSSCGRSASDRRSASEGAEARRTVAQSAAAPAALMTVGVVADTHIPDRVSTLHPQVLPMLRAAGVSHILHAGDICVPEVLDMLRQVAPVTAVRGNRDVFAGPLQMVEEFELGGVRVALLHGHGGLVPYLWDKVQFMRDGYRLERYLNRLVNTGNAASVVVFGHTHHPETLSRAGKLLFNPGSASFGAGPAFPPTLGLLRFFNDGKVIADIVPMEGYVVKNRKWVNETMSQGASFTG